MSGYDYIRDGAAIYRRLFATIRAEADLGRFGTDEARVAVRVIHACGMVEIADRLACTSGRCTTAFPPTTAAKPSAEAKTAG